jgi:predicted dehydrogenase
MGSTARVVAAVKGGSPDLSQSFARVDKFAEELRTKWSVEFVPDIAALCQRVDLVLVMSIDGRKHLGEIREVVRHKKPVFVDKPLSDTVADARAIERLARESGVPVWSASNFRYAREILALKVEEIGQAAVWGPGRLEPLYKNDLGYEGIHQVEILFTLLGPGVAEVSRTSTPDNDVLVGRWKDGRVGTAMMRRPTAPWGAQVFANRKVVQTPPVIEHAYDRLLEEIFRAYQTGRPPVPLSETVETVQFLEAAQRSKEFGGRPVALASV